MSRPIDEFVPSNDRRSDISDLHFDGESNTSIAQLLGVSTRTVSRELQRSNIPRFSEITDADLEARIVGIIGTQHAGIGELFIEGELTDTGIIVQRDRVRQVLRRLGHVRTPAPRICHMPYNANLGPHYTWHLDQNEKLKRWRFFILAVIDGFTRHSPHFVLVDNLTGQTHTEFFMAAVERNERLPAHIAIDGTDCWNAVIHVMHEAWYPDLQPDFLPIHNTLHPIERCNIGSSFHNTPVERHWVEVNTATFTLYRIYRCMIVKCADSHDS